MITQVWDTGGEFYFREAEVSGAWSIFDSLKFGRMIPQLHDPSHFLLF